jgi:hypothetical protein
VSVPATRLLQSVLREELAPSGLHLVLGKVVSVPDASHVRIELQGQQVTVPRISGYVPQANESVYCLSGEGLTLALGAASPAAVAPPLPGSASGQVPVWDAPSGRWLPQAKAPAAANADTLAGLGSAGYVRTSSSGSRIWAGGHGMVSSGGAGSTAIAHPLGVGPFVVASPVFPSQATVIGIGADAATITLHWSAINVSVSAHVLAIAP